MDARGCEIVSNVSTFSDTCPVAIINDIKNNDLNKCLIFKQTGEMHEIQQKFQRYARLSSGLSTGLVDVSSVALLAG